MKKIIIFTILLNTINIFSNNLKPKLKEVFFHELDGEVTDKAIVTPAFQNPIHASDLSASSNPQYSIKSSGRYYLADSLTQEHGTAGGIVLLVNSNNVSLNMNDKSIKPHVSGSLSTGIGIAVAQGLSNIAIMNGNITALDSSGSAKLNTGIDLSETSVSGGSGTSYSIKLNNLNITRCKLYGIDADTVNDLSIENVSSNDCSGSSACRGALLSTVNNLLIRNCEFNNNTSSGSYGEGIRLSSCTNVLVEDITANSNSTTGGLGSSGIYVSGGSNIQFKNSNASSNTSSASSAYGIAVLNAPLVSFENCNANNTNSSAGSTTGFYISGSGTNCKLIKCQANYNSSTNSHAYGMQIVENNTYLEECTANGNTTNADANAYGFYVNRPNNTFVRCQSNSNSCTDTDLNLSNANVYGVYLDSSCDNTTFIDSFSNNNFSTGDGLSTVLVAGFYTNANTNVRFERCTANNNQSSATSSTSYTAGFYFDNAESRSQIINCDASNNLSGDGSTSSSNARAYGIYFASTSGADQCIVKNCYLSHNSISSSGKAFGFYDNDTASTSLLTGNIAIGQGKCLGGTLDSSNQWNNNSEPSSSQNYFLKHAGTGDDPRTAIQEVPRESFTSISTIIQKWQNISVYDS